MIKSSTGFSRTLALPLGTRRCDGCVREECLRQIVEMDRTWVVPFIVQAIGECAIEIVEGIAAAIPVANAERFFQFDLANPVFMATTRRLATSICALRPASAKA